MDIPSLNVSRSSLKTAGPASPTALFSTGLNISLSTVPQSLPPMMSPRESSSPSISQSQSVLTPATGTDAASIVDTLNTAGSTESFIRAVQNLRRHMSDGTMAANIATHLATSELTWLHVMQRTFNDIDNAAMQAAMSEVICTLAQVGDTKVHRVLISGKLSSVLSARRIDDGKLAAAVVQCISGKADVNTFLTKQQGLTNLESFSKLASLGSAVDVLLHLTNLDATIIAELSKAKFDYTVGSRTVAAVKSKAAPAADIAKALLCLKQFIPTRNKDTAYLQMSCMLAATQVDRHIDTAADIADLICTAFVAQHVTLQSLVNFPRVMASLYVLGPHVAKRVTAAPTKFISILKFFVQNCVPHVTQENVTTLFHIFASSMHMLRPPFDVTLPLYLSLLQTIEAVCGAKKTMQVIRVGQLRRLRDMAAAIAGEKDRTLTKVALEAFLYKLARHCVLPCLNGVFLPLLPRVKSSEFSPAQGAHIAGLEVFDERRVSSFDHQLTAAIEEVFAKAQKIEANETRGRQVIRNELDLTRQEAENQFSLQRQTILDSPEHVSFLQFVAPVRRHLIERAHYSVASGSTRYFDAPVLASRRDTAPFHTGAPSPKRNWTAAACVSTPDQVSLALPAVAAPPPASSNVTWQDAQAAVVDAAWQQYCDDQRRSGLEALHEVEGEEERRRGIGNHFLVGSSVPLDHSILALEAQQWSRILASRPTISGANQPGGSASSLSALFGATQATLLEQLRQLDCQFQVDRAVAGEQIERQLTEDIAETFHDVHRMIFRASFVPTTDRADVERAEGFWRVDALKIERHAFDVGVIALRKLLMGEEEKRRRIQAQQRQGAQDVFCETLAKHEEIARGTVLREGFRDTACWTVCASEMASRSLIESWASDARLLIDDVADEPGLCSVVMWSDLDLSATWAGTMGPQKTPPPATNSTDGTKREQPGSDA